MAPTLDLPRSVLLALWLPALRSPAAPGTGRAGAVSAVTGDDEPHRIVGGRWTGLGDLFADAAAGRWDVAAVLPIPGDPLVGPRQAPAAGECVLIHDDEGLDLALVPEIHRFGSALEPGAMVTWHVHEVDGWRTAFLGAVGSLEDAERDLREGLLLATRALVQLDVARWRPDAAERLAAARDGALPARRLPAGLATGATSARRVLALHRAAQLRAIVTLAGEDEGGAVNLWQSDQRSAALREIDRAARRAMSAASARLRPRTTRCPPAQSPH